MISARPFALTPKTPAPITGVALPGPPRRKVTRPRSTLTRRSGCEPLFAPTYVARGHAWNAKKDFDKAIADFDDAIGLDPRAASAYTGRGYSWSQKNEYEKAIADYDTAIQLNADDAAALNGRAWLWSTCPDAKYRDGKRAVESARKACELTEWKDAMILDTLAAAFAEVGDFESAVKWQNKALGTATDEEYRDEFRARLVLYQGKNAYRHAGAD